MWLFPSADYLRETTCEPPGVLLIVLKPYRRPSLSPITALLLAMALLLSSPSHLSAYADPGTGSFLFQAAYAAFLGGAFYFRKFMGRIFRKRQ